MDYWKFLQFKFYGQWDKLRAYVNEKGIQIIGDIPIYVALDSADVWVHPELFQLDPETLKPLKVAGVPPDAFSETGQLWGNPLYVSPPGEIRLLQRVPVIEGISPQLPCL